MRRIPLSIAAAGVALALSFAAADARSCTDVLNSCMKMYGNEVHGKLPGLDAETQCRVDFNGCMQTGTWAGKTATYKGLQKK
jgi:hypothetical protein